MSDKKVVQDFFRREREIYDDFVRKEESARKNGLLPDQALVNKVGGITVAARHPSLAEQLMATNASIHRLTPCYVYDRETEHATFCCQTWDNFTYDRQGNGVISSGDMAEGLREAVSMALASLSQSQIKELIVDYRTVLFNRTTVIFPGAAHVAYVDLQLELTERCQQEMGTGMKTSWGTHITAARFLRQVDASQVRHFFDFMEDVSPLGESRLKRVDIAWVEASCVDMRFTTVAKFVLEPDGFRLA